MKNFLIFSLILFGSCGYRWQPDFPDALRPTLCIPFVQGDEDGMLTAQMIEAISCSGLAELRSYGAEYTLQVVIVGEESDKIGFRIDPQKVDGKIRKNLTAIEGRRSMTVEATLCSKGEVVHGPFRITADVDYDYVDGDSVQDLTFVDSKGKMIAVLPFSLGQLEPYESAALASTSSLYRRLAQKVVDAISSEW